MMNRQDLLKATLAGAALGHAQPPAPRTPETPPEIFLERPAEGTPHNGKVLLAVQAHADDIPLTAAGTVAKLVKEGDTGYLLRATNDDMGDAPGLGTPGSIGEHVRGNERDNAGIRASGRRPLPRWRSRSPTPSPTRRTLRGQNVWP
jgi:hypothetical protein